MLDIQMPNHSNTGQLIFWYSDVYFIMCVMCSDHRISIVRIPTVLAKTKKQILWQSIEPLKSME